MVKVLNKTITQNTYYISRIICLQCQKHQDVKSIVCHRPLPSAALHGAVSTVKRWPIYGKWRHLLCFCHIREISDTRTNSCRKIAGKIFHGCF